MQQHRPWPVWGHEWAVELFQHTLQPNNQPRHAYLLLGARQLGKSKLARTYAQALLCTSQSEQLCGCCRACELMARHTHPDFRLIQPVDKEGNPDRLDGTLRTEQASEIVHDVALKAVEGRYKIFLIQDFQAANASFANKLLKTLEEPPDQVIFLLTALDRSMVLPTILSRCQLIELRPLDVNKVEQALLEEWKVEPLQAKTLARLSGGRLGWAVEQLAQKDAQETRRTLLAHLWQLIQANRLERLSFAEQLAAGRNSHQLFGLLELWSTWWRDVLLTKSGAGELCSNIDCRQQLEEQAEKLSLESVQAYLKLLKRIEEFLHHTVNTRLALDVLLLRMPSV